MKTVFALVFLASVSKSVQRVREFRRNPEHENLLLYNGRPLSVEEFNKLSPKLLSDLGKQTYGVMPSVKLIEVEVPEISAPPEDTTHPLKTTAPTTPEIQPPTIVSPISLDLPTDVEVEAIDGGFVVGDYRDGDVQFLGGGTSGWQSDVSLTEPFPSADVAKAAFLGVTLPSLTDANQPPAEVSSPDGDTSATSVESTPATGETAPAASETAPETNSPASPDSSTAPATPPAKKQAKKQAKTKPASDAT